MLICGMLTSKDPAGFFRPFAGLVRHAMTVPVPMTRFRIRPGAPRRDRHAIGRPIAALPGRALGFAALCSTPMGDGPPRILICGSLYLAGSVLKENGPLPE